MCDVTHSEVLELETLIRSVLFTSNGSSALRQRNTLCLQFTEIQHIIQYISR